MLGVEYGGILAGGCTLVERIHNPEISAVILEALIFSTDLGLDADVFGLIMCEITILIVFKLYSYVVLVFNCMIYS